MRTLHLTMETAMRHETISIVNAATHSAAVYIAIPSTPLTRSDLLQLSDLCRTAAAAMHSSPVPPSPIIPEATH